MEITSMTSFIPYWQGIRERTWGVVRRIPDERLEWRAGEGRMSFGDLIRHLAVFERYVFAENVVGRPSRYGGHGRDLADGPAAVQAFLVETHAEAIAIFRGIDDEALQRRCVTPAGASITTWKWLRAMVEHEVHHRGQLYLMLGLLGVATPPVFGLTAEEVLANSLPPDRQT